MPLTEQQIEAERKAFELSVARLAPSFAEHVLDRGPNGDYIEPFMFERWESWLACAESKLTPPEGAVEVQVRAAIDPDGKWAAAGWTPDKFDPWDTVCESLAAAGQIDAAKRYTITAHIVPPSAEAEVVVGRVG